ncbi:carbohydrate esterase family 8 protein [Dothistroma septosporum NZE10]|uniref:Carbohydrate esterase family 8 protein n=1 Tax=Dothistroma septosporum (strain NZE10 / CBS 128990) TaxID=675120 RepID=N1Q232_DOTSN|nr:carbohydrate esterase family 8 protein [Dothistroma septosporum NZE10]
MDCQVSGIKFSRQYIDNPEACAPKVRCIPFTITQRRSQQTVPNDDLTATLRVWTKNFKLYNVNRVNSFGKGAEFLALFAHGQEGGYYGCQFKVHQHTVFPQDGVELYANSYTGGGADLVFGQCGQA